MQVVNPKFIKSKKVLLRYDIDVALGKGTGYRVQVTEDFKLRAGLETLDLCLKHAQSVILMGHMGRPSFAEATEGKPDKFFVPRYSVKPIREWFFNQGYEKALESGKLRVLENLRFDPREEAGDKGFAKELAAMGEVYVNEAFASYRPAVSTTVLPALLPRYAGLRFAREVGKLREIRENPKKPFVVIIGGTKVKDKLPVINVLAQKADVVLVGGKIASEMTKSPASFGKNVLIGRLNAEGTDVAPETIAGWKGLLDQAAMIIWNGPVGKFEDAQNDQSAKLAQMVLNSNAEIVVGGGDTVSLLGSLGILEEYEKRAFVSVGGGAMLKFLTDGTLPTIQALD